ncbi:hypothetical protein QTP70_000663 [Hemibagrus guttatus]|uniref:Uncharacterized protein n=1 Tax=Hemibagrus guttatus TaxID=175788 RepID=A0AAE0QBM3_9TELE|nr:hypothetical protein QTP70_000663 [Hemibagrus guttatus]KAK3546852.1 hypothetical protein QTP86_003051 [Hemibagrus guttatus]
MKNRLRMKRGDEKEGKKGKRSEKVVLSKVCRRYHGFCSDLSVSAGHQLKLNPSKTELLVIPGDPSSAQDPALSLNNSMISPSATARNLGVNVMKTHPDKTENRHEISFLNPWAETISRNGESPWSIRSRELCTLLWLHFLLPPVVQMQNETMYDSEKSRDRTNS